jgi:exosortase A
MTQRALPYSRSPMVDLTGWRGHLIALGVVSATILTLFFDDVWSMASIWWNASTFGHCLFIPPIIAWLVQQRMPGLRQMEPVAWVPGLLWLALGAFAWLLGAAAGVAMVRHGALVLMVQGATIALLGPTVARALTFPLFYAFFMVPFGEEIVPPLQLVTARLALLLLDLTGVPAHLEGIFITTPTGYFEVAEACSGAKFLIAMAAYGVLVCNVCFTSWRRRILFLTGALILSVLANGVRAYATILVAHLTTVDAAVGFDHVVYGWVFFAIIMVVVMAVAWPFFDRRPGDVWFDPRHLQGPVTRSSHAGAIAGGALAIIVSAPLWLAASVAAAQPLPRVLTMPDVPGWTRTDAPQAYPWKPRFEGADHFVIGRYRNGAGQVVDLAIATYDRQDDGHDMVGFGQGAADPDSEWVWSFPARSPAYGRGEQITAPGPVVRHAVTFHIVGHGNPTGSKPAVKMETMLARLLGSDQRAAAIIVSAEEGDGHPSDPAIAAFLKDLGDVKLLADRSIGIR